MKLYYYLLIFISFLVLVSCAKQSTPLGGPRDDTPPKLTSIYPENESTNAKPETIIIEFDEYVKLDNANRQLIISPRINKDEMEVQAIKNKVTITLNQELDDSTTYVFNFQKSIQDITESNPAENLQLVFSTGQTIDSLKFTGNVAYTFHQKNRKIEDVLVGLYPSEDTTNIFSDPPYYIGRADSLGNFIITNIKAGDYRAFAWHDSNNSLKVEDKVEPYGFLSDTVSINKNIEQVQFYLTKSEITPLKVSRTTTIGNNFDVIFSKGILEAKVEPTGPLQDSLYYRIKENTLRLYHSEMGDDSTSVKLIVQDSVGFKLDTLIFARFEKTTRPKEKLEATINSGENFVNTIRSRIVFNKPIKTINFDSLLVKFDSASFIRIEDQNVYFQDSSRLVELNIELTIPDSILFSSFQLTAADSTFMDIEGVFNESIEGTYRKLKKEGLADALTIEVNTNERPIILQVINSKGEIVKEQYLLNTNKHSFYQLEAGTYTARAIIDTNKNRKWDPSNYLENRQAEPIYYFVNPDNDNATDILLKGGWENEIIIQPNMPVGYAVDNSSELTRILK